MTLKKIGIITKIDPNHGSCIFDRSLFELISNSHKDGKVDILEYPFSRSRIIELLRAMKISKGVPFYNLSRHIRLAEYSRNTVSRKNLFAFPTYREITQRLEKQGYDVVIPSKVLWNITYDRKFPPFPNFYWPSEELSAIKIAYAISGHRTDLELFRKIKDKVKNNLETYKLIGVRDDMTQIMMEEAGVDRLVPVMRVTDPSFLYKPKKIDLNELLSRFSIRPDIPIIGLLIYGKPQLSAAIRTHYHAKGYQVVNFNMNNPFADFNIGHLVDPDEWVALFKSLSFCITDRFHGLVFCLREGIPFTSIEPSKPKTLLNSKIYSLLKEFELTESCYFDTYTDAFSVPDFLARCDQLERIWSTEFFQTVQFRVSEKNEAQREFAKKVIELIG